MDENWAAEEGREYNRLGQLRRKDQRMRFSKKLFYDVTAELVSVRRYKRSVVQFAKRERTRKKRAMHP